MAPRPAIKRSPEQRVLAQGFIVPPYFFHGAGAAAAFVGGVLFFCGLTLFFWQVIHWLMYAVWIPLDLHTLLTVRGVDGLSPRWPLPEVAGSIRWLSAPEAWLGLHKALVVMLGLLPVQLIMAFGGILLWLRGNDLVHIEREADKARSRRGLGYDEPAATQD